MPVPWLLGQPKCFFKQNLCLLANLSVAEHTTKVTVVDPRETLVAVGVNPNI